MNRRYFHLAFALLVLLSLSAGSFTLGSTSSYQNDTLAARVDKLFAQWDKPNSPGGMLAIIRDGKIIYERGHGAADLEHNVSISPETVFNIASTSKQFTAMSILLLTRQGKMSLDDDIRKYVPELPKYDSPITVRQLIHHTSGLRDYLGLMALAGVRQEDYYDQDDVMELMVRQKHLNFKPANCLTKNLLEMDSLPQIKNLLEMSEISFAAKVSGGVKDEVNDEREKAPSGGHGRTIPAGAEERENSNLE